MIGTSQSFNIPSKRQGILFCILIYLALAPKPLLSGNGASDRNLTTQNDVGSLSIITVGDLVPASPTGLPSTPVLFVPDYLSKPVVVIQCSNVKLHSPIKLLRSSIGGGPLVKIAYNNEGTDLSSKAYAEIDLIGGLATIQAIANGSDTPPTSMKVFAPNGAIVDSASVDHTDLNGNELYELKVPDLIDTSKFPNYSVVLAPDGKTLSAVFGIMKEDEVPSYLGFSAGSSIEPLREFLVDRSQATEILGEGNGFHDATRYLLPARQAQGYTATFFSKFDANPRTASAPITIYKGEIPRITLAPNKLIFSQGESVTLTFNASTSGLSVKWKLNGSDLFDSESKDITFFRKTLDVADNGLYSASLMADERLIATDSVSIVVLGNPSLSGIPAPSFLSFPTIPERDLSKDNLVLVTHGLTQGESTDLSYLDRMSNSIAKNKTLDNSWQIETYKWPLDASKLDTLLRNAAYHGEHLGQILRNQQWKHIHLIGHSGGAALIEAASARIKAIPSQTEVHTTFLDAYLGIDLQERGEYGRSADWSDSYFSNDLTVDFTGGVLNHAYNVDVSGRAPNAERVAMDCNFQPLPTECRYIYSVPFTISALFYGHSWPFEFYLKTVEDSAYEPALGFWRSLEANGWSSRNAFQENNNPPQILGDQGGVMAFLLELPSRVERLVLRELPLLKSNAELVSVNENDFQISSGSPSSIVNRTARIQPETGAWVSLGIVTTNTPHSVLFDFRFFGATNASGLLSVYCGTNQLGTIDQRFTIGDFQSRRYLLPTNSTDGALVIGFRLDAFSDLVSSVTVTNIAISSFAEQKAPRLSIERTQTGGRNISVDGPTGVNYLIQASTNLTTWTPVGIVSSTNAIKQILDQDQSFYRFYRATGAR